MAADGAGDPGLRRIRVAMVAPAVLNLPLWMAMEHGAFEERGLAVEVSVIGTTHGTTSALVSGAVEVSLAGPEPALADPDQVSIIAGLADKPPFSLIAIPEISSIEQLRGREVGTTSLTEGTVHLVRTILAAHGLHYPEDYGFAIAGAHPQRWQALQDGSLDAALQLVPFDYMAEEAGFSVLARAEDYLPRFAFAAACVRTDWAAEEPALVRTIISCLRVGENLVREQRDAAVDAAVRHAHLSKDHAERAIERLTDGGVMPEGLEFSQEALDSTRAALAQLGEGT